MTNYSPELINKILAENKISQISFIQGIKKYNFISSQVSPDCYKKRPYVIYRGVINKEPVILKVLVRSNYSQFFQRELFVYQYLGKIIPQVGKFLPKIINFAKTPLPYILMKDYKYHHALGQYNLLMKDITEFQLLSILTAIDSFHQTKKEVEFKIKSHNLISPFTVTEPFSFYLQRYHRETKKYLGKILNSKKLDKLEELFSHTKPAFNKINHYFSWGDVNPANILIAEKNNRYDIRFIDFEKVGYSYLPRDYTTFYYSIYLTNIKLADFFCHWLKNKYPDRNFWIVFYFKLLIYSFPRQYRYFEEKQDFYHQKKIVECATISKEKYLNLF